MKRHLGLMSQANALPAGVKEAPSNTAVTQVYEPGSVFKLVTFSAALAAGVISPSQQLQVPAALPMGTYTFHDAEQHPSERLSASQVLAQSSNIGTIEVAQALGLMEALYQDQQSQGAAQQAAGTTRIEELKAENARLRRKVADLVLYKRILQELAKGNW